MKIQKILDPLRNCVLAVHSCPIWRLLWSPERGRTCRTMAAGLQHQTAECWMWSTKHLRINESFSFEAWQDQIDHVWKCWCIGYRGRIFRQGFTAEMQMAWVWAGLSRSEVLLPLPWGERYSGGLRTATCCAWHIAPACSSYCTTPASPVMWLTQGLPSFSLCIFFFQSFCASHYASHVLYLDPKIFWYLLTFPPNRFPILRLLFWIWSLSRKLLR